MSCVVALAIALLTPCCMASSRSLLVSSTFADVPEGSQQAGAPAPAPAVVLEPQSPVGTPESAPVAAALPPLNAPHGQHVKSKHKDHEKAAPPPKPKHHHPKALPKHHGHHAPPKPEPEPEPDVSPPPPLPERYTPGAPAAHSPHGQNPPWPFPWPRPPGMASGHHYRSRSTRHLSTRGRTRSQGKNPWSPLLPFLAWPHPGPGGKWPPLPLFPFHPPPAPAWPHPGGNWPPLPPFPFHPPSTPTWPWPHHPGNPWTPPLSLHGSGDGVPVTTVQPNPKK